MITTQRTQECRGPDIYPPPEEKTHRQKNKNGGKIVEQERRDEFRKPKGEF